MSHNPEIGHAAAQDRPRMPKVGQHVTIAPNVNARYAGHVGVVISRCLGDNEVLMRLKGRPDAWFAPSEISSCAARGLAVTGSSPKSSVPPSKAPRSAGGAGNGHPVGVIDRPRSNF
jgi:hypothetical protein